MSPGVQQLKLDVPPEKALVPEVLLGNCVLRVWEKDGDGEKQSWSCLVCLSIKVYIGIYILE